MIDTLYIENEVADHPRVRAVRKRFPRAVAVPISRYGEVFNRNHQSFRLQKKNPSLILARKRQNHLMPAPYGIGGEHNFYFSHVLNCLYDCRYCFLQGMYRSAHYVLFVNYEEFQRAIAEEIGRHPDEDVFFFSGYDGDSLALEPVTGFVQAFAPFFARHRRAVLELRTKSARVKPLLAHEPFPNVVVAFSFTPEAIHQALEHKVPPVSSRVFAMKSLAERGWKIGLRFDPLVFETRYRERYRELFRNIFASIPVSSLHSVSLGPFRLPRDYFHRMVRLYPEEKLFAGLLEDRGGVVSYAEGTEAEMRSFCTEELSCYVPREILFPCQVEVR